MKRITLWVDCEHDRVASVRSEIDRLLKHIGASCIMFGAEELVGDGTSTR